LWFTIRNRALHAVDTALSVTAVLESQDTMVQVLTPTSSFPAMPRRTSANNRSTAFTVRCDSGAQQNDTVMLRLEVTFTDAGVTITQPLSFRLVIGTNPVAIEEPQIPGSKPQTPGLAARPNPARGRVILETGDLPGVLRIYSQSGRLVRTMSAGRSVTWDGRDHAGRPVPAGVYFASLASGKGGALARVVIVEE
jgi:hypothetical protein